MFPWPGKPPIFLSAPAIPPGSRVNCTAEASARYSRCREMAACSILAKSTPTDPTNQTARPATTIAITTPPPFESREPRMKRNDSSKIRPRTDSITRPKIHPINLMFSFMSPLRIWLNSCATTPCSSERVRRSKVPRVTPMTALLGSVPAAKAFIPCSSSMIHTSGTGTPEAIAISSTTFRSRCSCRSVVEASTCLPPRSRATTFPPAESWTSLKELPTTITPPTIAVVHSSRSGSHQPVGPAPGAGKAPSGTGAMNFT